MVKIQTLLTEIEVWKLWRTMFTYVPKGNVTQKKKNQLAIYHLQTLVEIRKLRKSGVQTNMKRKLDVNVLVGKSNFSTR